MRKGWDFGEKELLSACQGRCQPTLTFVHCHPFAHSASVEMPHWMESVVKWQQKLKLCTEVFGQERRENAEKFN